MFFGPDVEREGVGGCRDLPWWTFGLFQSIALVDPRLKYFGIKVWWQSTSNEGPPAQSTSSGWGPHSGREKKSDHFVGQRPIHCQFWWWWWWWWWWCWWWWWWWWSLCRQVCEAHGDCHATAKLGRIRDIVRLPTRAFRQQYAGSRDLS